MRFLLATMLGTLPAWGCSCVGSLNPCSAVTPSSVVFVARVITESGDGWGKGPAKVAIEEALQNVPPGEVEATINTAAGTSCYFPLKAGERYVIITAAGRYSVSACSSSFRLGGNEHILEALRDGLKGNPTLVGSIYQSATRYSTSGFVSGVTVSAEISGHKPRPAVSDGSGHFRFAGLPAGTYRLSVSKAGYLPDDDFNRRNNGLPTSHLILDNGQPIPGQAEVSAAAVCTYRNLSMWPRGKISGTVRDENGAPIKNVRVQAFPFDEKNKRDTDLLQSALTKADGSYLIEPLPPGNFAIGVNGRRYSDENVYPPTFYAGGKGVYLAESGSTDGVDLVLPRPRIAAQLTVKVLDPDGKAHEGATLRLDDPQGEQRAFTRDKTNASGEITLTVYVGERYSVRAFHYINRADLEGIAPLVVTDTAPRLTLHLQPKKRDLLKN